MKTGQCKMKALNLLLFILSFGFSSAQPQIIDNGYEGILVKIEDSVAEHLCNGIFNGIKVMLIASQLSSIPN